MHRVILFLAYAHIKPYAVFSSGLFSTMPSGMYSTIKDMLNKNLTLVESNSMLRKKDFEELCDKYEMDKLSLIAHSSIDSAILSSHRLKKAVLIDPATVPSLSINGLVSSQMKTRAPIKIIYSKLYGDFVLPSFQPKFEEAQYISYDSSGHGDILDPPWARVSSWIGIPSEPETRSDFKKFVSDECIDFIIDSCRLVKNIKRDTIKVDLGQTQLKSMRE